MPSNAVPEDRSDLLAWAESQGVEACLALTAGAVADRLPAAVAEGVRSWGGALTVADLAAPDRWTRRTLEARLPAEDAGRVVAAVRAWLGGVASERAEARAEAEALDAATPPEPAVLAELWERLSEARTRLAEAHPARPRRALVLPRVHLEAEAPSLVYAEGLGAAARTVRLPLGSWDVELAPACDGCGPGGCEHALAALDAVRHRLLALGADPGAAGPLTAILAAPPWERLFAALDGEAEAASAEPEPLRWTLSGSPHRPELRPTGDVGAGAGTEADRRAGAWLVAEEDGAVAPARVLFALRALVGHPAVHLEGREAPVAVREGRLSLVAEEVAGRAFALEPALDDRVVRLEDLLRRMEAAGAGGPFLDVDRAAGAVRIYDVSSEARRVLLLLDRHGSLFPAESHEALLARVPALQGVLPVRLPAAARGEEMAPDPTPVLRLVPVGEAGLRVAVRVRPVPGGPDFPPGLGAAEVHGRLGPARVYARRDLGEERARAAAAVQGLPGLAPERADAAFSWRVAGEEALDLVRHLGTLAEDGLRVEWPQGAVSWKVRTVHPAGLRIQVQASRDWFGLAGGVEVDGEQVQLALLLEAVRRGERYLQVRGGLWVALAEDLRERLAALADQVDADGGVGPAGAPALADLLDEAADVDAGEAWDELEARLQAARRLEAPVPAGLRATLRPYQLTGFRWMARLAAWGAGAVLADDMGLGKTLQTITLLLHRREEGPALVVAPTSVGPNWVKEVGRFAPDLRVVLYGAEPDRAAAVEALGPGDVLVVSYGLLTRDLERLAPVRFGTLVLDEAQAVKNPSATRTRAARSLDAGFRLALTGTPVENHLGELWSLFSVVLPGLLGSHRRFRDRFVLPIEKDGQWSRREALSRVVRPFVLRRTKGEVLDELPPRVDVEVSVRLSPDERRLYEEARLAAVARITGLAASGSGEAQGRFEILSAITRLRLLACHPRLADDESGVPSAKLGRLMEILDELKEAGHRTLVFSQFTRHLQLVREALDARGADYLYLDGATPTARRGQLVDRFQRGRGDVFLISLKAGGTGLNLTGADHVIHLDPWWNPALEDQATDRAHRMGQQRSVTVLRMVAQGTIEEAIQDLHRHKRGLLAGILDGADAAAALSFDQIRDLLAEGRDAFAEEDEDGEAGDGAPADAATAPPPEAAVRERRHRVRRPGAGAPRPARAARVLEREPAPEAPETPTLDLRPPPPDARAGGAPHPGAPGTDRLPEALGGSPAALTAAIRRLEAALASEGARGARTYPRALARFAEWAAREAARLPRDADAGALQAAYLEALAAGVIPAPPDEPVVARPALARLFALLDGARRRG